jgi:hypothetical protein
LGAVLVSTGMMLVQFSQPSHRVALTCSSWRRIAVCEAVEGGGAMYRSSCFINDALTSQTKGDA